MMRTSSWMTYLIASLALFVLTETAFCQVANQVGDKNGCAEIGRPETDDTEEAEMPPQMG